MDLLLRLLNYTSEDDIQKVAIPVVVDLLLRPDTLIITKSYKDMVAIPVVVDLLLRPDTLIITKSYKDMVAIPVVVDLLLRLTSNGRRELLPEVAIPVVVDLLLRPL